MTENHTINMQTVFDKLKGTKNVDALLCVHIMCESTNSNNTSKILQLHQLTYFRVPCKRACIATTLTIYQIATSCLVAFCQTESNIGEIAHICS